MCIYLYIHTHIYIYICIYIYIYPQKRGGWVWQALKTLLQSGALAGVPEEHEAFDHVRDFWGFNHVENGDYAKPYGNDKLNSLNSGNRGNRVIELNHMLPLF